MGKTQARRKRVPAPSAGQKRAFRPPAPHAPSSLIDLRSSSVATRKSPSTLGFSLAAPSVLSHLQAVGGNSAAAYTPAARRRAGRLRSVYVGERWHKFFVILVEICVQSYEIFS